MSKLRTNELIAAPFIRFVIRDSRRDSRSRDLCRLPKDLVKRRQKASFIGKSPQVS